MKPVLTQRLDDEAATQSYDGSESPKEPDPSERWRQRALGQVNHGRFERTGALFLYFAPGATPTPIGSDLIELVGHLLAP
ncbi:MAG TPA: hypothetical protein VF331_22595 [Polyangiales bacterium]